QARIAEASPDRSGLPHLSFRPPHTNEPRYLADGRLQELGGARQTCRPVGRDCEPGSPEHTRAACTAVHRSRGDARITRLDNLSTAAAQINSFPSHPSGLTLEAGGSGLSLDGAPRVRYID